MVSIKTLEQFTDRLEKQASKVSTGLSSLTDFEKAMLAHDIGLVEYCTPLSWINEKCMADTLSSARKQWPRKEFENYLMSYDKGNFWNRLTEEQRYFLLQGKEIGES